MSQANAVSDLERAEHLGYDGGKGVKRVSIFNAGVQTNVATESKQDDIVTAVENVSHEEDDAHTSSDKGVMGLTVRKDSATALAGADGDYQPLVTNEHGILRSQAQQHLHMECCGSADGWTVLGNDTINLATTTNHVFGTVALEFDKVNGAADTVFAGIQKTTDSTSLSAYHKGGGFFIWSTYLSDVTNVDYLFLRLGTDSSNYNEFRVTGDEFTAGWISARAPMHSPAAIEGDGWNSTAITYIAVGVAFDLQNNELADIAVDHIAANTGLQTSTDISAEVSSSVTTPNVNLLKVKNKVVDTQSGDVGTGTQRIAIASDDVNLAAINTGVSALDTFVSTTVTLTTEDTAYKLPSSEQASRRTIIIYNKSDTDVYIGSSSVTTATGILLPAGGRMSLDCVSGVYAICGTAGKAINVLECK